jgi:hypothetical protein
MSTDLIEAGVVAIAHAIAAGEATSESVTQRALARLETRGRRFNGVVMVEAERALQTARAIDKDRAQGKPLGPLAGVPMAHKDLFYRAGRPSACGSKIRRGFVPSVTSSALAKLDAAGGVDCGALHMAEFALSPTGYNEHDGHGLNPWSPAHVCGGSSSGSGVVVACASVLNCLPRTQASCVSLRTSSPDELATKLKPDLSRQIAAPGQLVALHTDGAKSSQCKQTASLGYYIKPCGGGWLVRDVKTCPFFNEPQRPRGQQFRERRCGAGRRGEPRFELRGPARRHRP